MILNPVTQPHRSPRWYGLAVRYLSHGLEGPRGTFVDAVPMPLTPADAAPTSIQVCQPSSRHHQTRPKSFAANSQNVRPWSYARSGTAWG